MAGVKKGRFAVHLLDVGQGESIILDFPDGTFGLIDAGPRKDAAGVVSEVAARVSAGARFRFAAASQWDQDHIAGMAAVIRAHPPEEFLRPAIDLSLLEALLDASNGSIVASHATEIRAACQAGDVAERLLSARDSLGGVDGLGDVKAIVLSPSPTLAGEMMDARSLGMTSTDLRRWRNRASLVVWITYLGRTLFLGGEAEGDQYQQMAELFRSKRNSLNRYGQPEADWVKLSHHGADANNPEEIFHYFAKDKFYGSASAGGRYGHPHPATLQRLVDAGGQAMCTRLGQGCSLILNHGLDPERPETWPKKHLPILDAPNPDETCYGTVTVELGNTGLPCRLEVRGTASQARCPYRGPATARLALAANR